MILDLGWVAGGHLDPRDLPGEEAGKATTLSSTIRSGSNFSKISYRRTSRYSEPPISAWKVGAMKSRAVHPRSRKTGAVSRMKSFQNWSETSSSSSGGSQAHRPLLEDLGGEGAGEGLLGDETVRWPRFRSASPMPTQSWSGLKPSGKRRLSPGRPYSPSLPSTASACRAAREVAVRSTCDREDAGAPGSFQAS